MEQSTVSNKVPLKIINPGMYRGGTASLSLALRELGFVTWHLRTNTEVKKNHETEQIQRYDNVCAYTISEVWIDKIQPEFHMAAGPRVTNTRGRSNEEGKRESPQAQRCRGALR